MNHQDLQHEYDSTGYCTKCSFCNKAIFTSHCAGSTITQSQYNKVYTGELDFRFGTWVSSSSYISPLFPEESLRNEKIITELMLRQNKVISIEAYKYQKRIINAYDNIIKSN